MPREIGDIENDLGFIEGHIDDLEEQLNQARAEKAILVDELEISHQAWSA